MKCFECVSSLFFLFYLVYLLLVFNFVHKNLLLSIVSLDHMSCLCKQIRILKAIIYLVGGKALYGVHVPHTIYCLECNQTLQPKIAAAARIFIEYCEWVVDLIRFQVQCSAQPNEFLMLSDANSSLKLHAQTTNIGVSKILEIKINLLSVHSDRIQHKNYPL